MNLTQIIYVAVHNSVQYESLMTSVERVLEYSELPPEEGYQVESQPPAEWPQEGSISCENVSLVYYEGGPTTLNNVTFTIKAKEKASILMSKTTTFNTCMVFFNSEKFARSEGMVFNSSPM